MNPLEKIPEGLKSIAAKAPKIVAAAAEKMVHANFSAQGFVQNGSADPKWARRKVESSLTQGKRVLSGTGRLEESVKASSTGNIVTVGVDLGKVPYAKIHNEGGTINATIKAHRRTSRRGKSYTVKTHARKTTYPQRQFLGPSPDVLKIAEKELTYMFNQLNK